MADWDWGAQFGDDDDDENEEGGGYQKVWLQNHNVMKKKRNLSYIAITY